MGNTDSKAAYQPSEVKVAILDARNLPLYRKRKNGTYSSNTIVIFSIGDQVVRTLERSTETGNAVYNQTWTFQFTMPERSPLLLQIKDIELGILGTHEIPFEDIPFCLTRERKTLFSFVFDPPILKEKSPDVKIINNEKQCELLLSARTTKHSLQLYSPKESTISFHPRTRRWTIHNCTIQEVDFIDNVQQWRELPLAKRMRVDSVFYGETKRVRFRSCLRFREEEEEAVDSREFILPSSPYSGKSIPLDNQFRVKITPDMEDLGFAKRQSFVNFLPDEQVKVKSLANLLSDLDHKVDILALLKATKNRRSFFPETTPFVYGVHPNRVPINEDTVVRIVGKNFGQTRQDLQHVFICGADCINAVLQWSANAITCRVQCNVMGRGVVTVCTISGGVGICADLIEFYELDAGNQHGNVYALLKLMENAKAFEEEMVARNVQLVSSIAKTDGLLGEWKAYLRKLQAVSV